MARHITNPRDRASKKYKALHAELRAEVEAMRKPKRREPRQARHRAKDELYREYGENAAE